MPRGTPGVGESFFANLAQIATQLPGIVSDFDERKRQRDSDDLRDQLAIESFRGQKRQNAIGNKFNLAQLQAGVAGARESSRRFDIGADLDERKFKLEQDKLGFAKTTATSLPGFNTAEEALAFGLTHEGSIPDEELNELRSIVRLKSGGRGTLGFSGAGFLQSGFNKRLQAEGKRPGATFDPGTGVQFAEGFTPTTQIDYAVESLPGLRNRYALEPSNFGKSPEELEAIVNRSVLDFFAGNTRKATQALLKDRFPGQIDKLSDDEKKRLVIRFQKDIFGVDDAEVGSQAGGASRSDLQSAVSQQPGAPPEDEQEVRRGDILGPKEFDFTDPFGIRSGAFDLFDDLFGDGSRGESDRVRGVQ